MNYPGGKQRLAKEILSVILSERKQGQPYVEPFVGGANVIAHVPPEQGSRTGFDGNSSLIAFWTKVTAGWVPPKTFSKTQHQKAKLNPENYEPHLLCWYALAHSFSHTWFGTYLEGDKRRAFHLYSQEFWHNIKKQLPLLSGVNFLSRDYLKLKFKTSTFIYCDPPYANKTGYRNAGNFNSLEFWNWARTQHLLGHRIFVSEYNAPKDWKVIWQKERQIGCSQTGLKGNPSLRVIEKLFTYGKARS